MAENLDHCQVVTDKQIRQIVLLLQTAQQFYHLALHGAIQCRRWFVEQDQLGLEHQCPGNRDPLPLAAGELVRVAVAGLRIQADFFQRLNHHLFALGLSADTVNLQPLADDLAYRHARAQTAIRVLKDHLKLTAQRANLLLAQAIKPGAVAFDQPLAVDQSEQGHAQRGLARAAFTDNAQSLPAGQGKADVGHCLDVIHGAPQHAFFDRKPDPQLLCPQNLRGVRINGDRFAARVGRKQLTGIFMLR